MEQTLQNLWAHTTLDVIERVATKQGFNMYRYNPAMREDLHSWLIVKAQETATRYQPNLTNPRAEDTWAGYLWKTLIAKSRWHWEEYHGNNKANEEAARTTKSIQELAAQALETGYPYEATMTAIAIPQQQNPEALYLYIEHLEETLDSLNNHTAPPTQNTKLCIEPACLHTAMATTPRCTYHNNKHKELWDPGKRCTREGCTDRATKRELCNNHYSAARQMAKGNGEPWNTRKPAQLHCTVEDCGRPHNSNGLCNSHLAKARRERMGPCTIPGCTNKQNTKQMCHTHYAQARKGQLNG